MFNLFEPQVIDWGVAWPALAGVAYLVAMSPALTIIDLRERRLPNRIVLPALPLSTAGQVVAASLDASLWSRMSVALISAALVFAFAVFANVKGQLGMGDAKLMTAITLSLGWFNPLLVPLSLFVAAVTGLVEIALCVAVRRSLHLTGSIALGPHLMLATLGLTVFYFLISVKS